MLKKAKDLSETKQYDTAIQILTSAIDTEPSNAEIYQELGWAYFCKNDFHHANEYSTKAIELNPEIPIPYVTLANIELAKKDYSECYRFSEKAYNLDTNLDLAIAAFGTASYLVGKIDQAIMLLEKARDISPEKPYIRNNLAIAYTMANQNTLAFQEFQKANQLSPSWEARYKMFSSYLAQPVLSQKVSFILWVISICLFLIILISLALKSVALLLFPTLFFLLLTLFFVVHLVKFGPNRSTLGGAIASGIFSCISIILIYLIVS
jgi:tetratricopeptide (TPR) repeat protein